MKTKKLLLLGILTVTTALASQVNAQSILTNGLIAYYPFNGNGNDTVNGYNITNSIIPLTADRFGVSNAAVVLSQAMWATNMISVQSFDPRTISEWVKVKDYPGNTTSNFGPKPSANFVNFFHSTIIGNCLASDGEFFLDTGIGGLAFCQLPAPTNWAHIVVVYSGRIDTAKVYFNGQSVPLNRSVDEGTGFAFPSQAYPIFDELHYQTGPGISGFSTNNFIDDVRIYNRALSSSEVQQLYDYESGPRVNLIKAVKPSFSNLTLGTNYQLQVSGNLNTWTNQGVTFTATNTTMIYPQYFDVDNWSQLFFRLQVAP